MYTFYPEIHISFEGIFIKIESPWFVERISNIKKDFSESRVFEFPIFHYTPRINFSNKVSQFPKIKGWNGNSNKSESSIYDEIKIRKNSIVENYDVYDPISIYTAIQHERLLLCSKENRSINFINQLIDLLKIDEKQFFKIITEILLQSYYVTFNCYNCLLPSTCGNNVINKFMTKYIQEEYGHHTLIELTLKELNPSLNLEKEKFSDEVIEIMQILKELAYVSNIGLACALGFFEAASFQSSDSLADLLKISSKPNSAIGINRHFAINRNGNHCLVGFELAKLIDKYISLEELNFSIQKLGKIERLSFQMMHNIFDLK